jgi:hypothetical protein
MSNSRADASSPKASIPNAEDWLGDLDKKTSWQIHRLMNATDDMIRVYAENVANAGERYHRERELLAGMMALYSRLAHYVVRKGAMALESTASAGEAGTAETTEIGSVHEHATAEGGDAQ